MNNIWKKIDKPFTALAPLAGYTDQPFRLVCKEYGVDVLYSEMVSSEAIWHNKQTKNIKQLKKTLDLIRFSKVERPYIVQLFGSNAEHMKYAAKYIVSGKWADDFQTISNESIGKDESIPDGIDVNMGCPVKDVVGTGSGVALMRDASNAVEIVKALKSVNNLAISVKTRLGWEKETEILEFSKMIEQAGADAIAIHGRTYRQGFAGRANWKIMEKVKSLLSIPTIGNGGIKFENCRMVIDNYKLDGYMVGTGALGKPWIFNEIKNQESNIKTNVSLCDDYIKKTILKHCDLMEELKGKNSVVEFRKQLVWYAKGLDNAREIRKRFVQVDSFEEVREIIKDML